MSVCLEQCVSRSLTVTVRNISSPDKWYLHGCAELPAHAVRSWCRQAAASPQFVRTAANSYPDLLIGWLVPLRENYPMAFVATAIQHGHSDTLSLVVSFVPCEQHAILRDALSLGLPRATIALLRMDVFASFTSWCKPYASVMSRVTISTLAAPDTSSSGSQASCLDRLEPCLWMYTCNLAV